MRWKRWLVLGIVSLVSLTGCATPREPMVSMEKSLYERLGGKPAITAVVDDFVGRNQIDGHEAIVRHEETSVHQRGNRGTAFTRKPAPSRESSKGVE